MPRNSHGACDNACLDPSTLEGPWWQGEDSQWHRGERLTDEQKVQRGWK